MASIPKYNDHYILWGDRGLLKSPSNLLQSTNLLIIGEYHAINTYSY